MKGGYALGLTSVRDKDGFKFSEDTYQSLAAAKNFENWEDAYRRLKLPQNDPDSVRVFMEKITKENKPIVMFVPNWTKSYKNRSWATKYELNWLLNNPEKMKNVRFVFGAYDVFPEEVLQPMVRAALVSQRKREILIRYLRHMADQEVRGENP